MGKTGTNIAQQANPINTSVSSTTRTWDDVNRNFVSDCDLRNFDANGECGPISDRNFGRDNPRATRYADDVLRGFGVRDYFWDIAAEVQHELRAGVSLNGGYYRNWRRNLSATDNLAVTPADYDPFCITAPLDSRLPGGGGYEVCGLYDVKPSKFGLVENVVTQASHYGDPSVVSDFFGVSFNARFGSGLRLGGGLDTGRSVNDNCFVVDSPQQLLNCRVVTPYKAQTDMKLNWSYPLPGDFVVSGIFQNVSGPALNTTWAVSNAQVVPSLGRNLAACGTRAVCTATVTVPLTAPQTQFNDDRRTQIDLRLAKIFRVSQRGRLQANRRLMTSPAVASFHRAPLRVIRTLIRVLQVASVLPLPMGRPPAGHQGSRAGHDGWSDRGAIGEQDDTGIRPLVENRPKMQRVYAAHGSAMGEAQLLERYLPRAVLVVTPAASVQEFEVKERQVSSLTFSKLIRELRSVLPVPPGLRARLDAARIKRNWTAMRLVA